MTALGKLFRTTAFKLTLVYLTIFALFAAIVLVYFAWNTRRLINEQITQTVDSEIVTLQDEYDLGGIRRRLGHPLLGNRNAVGVADDLAFRRGQAGALIRLDLIQHLADGIFCIRHGDLAGRICIRHGLPPWGRQILWHLVCQRCYCQAGRKRNH